MKRKPLFRLVSVLLILLMLLPLLVSCKEETGKEKETTNEDEGTVYEGENGYVLAVNNYNGAAFNVADSSYATLYVDEESGDSLLDAVYRRNLKVEDLYKIDLTVIDCSDTEEGFVSTVSAAILSGTDSYNLICSNMGTMATHTLSTGYYQNLLDLPYLDFDQPWWPGEVIESSRIGNRMYGVIGNIDASYYDLFTAILFNKELAADYPIGDLYQLVRDGAWTLDKLIEYSHLAEIDLDGDGMMDPKIYQFGLTIHRSYPTHAFVTALGVQLTDVDEDGIPTILPLSEHYVDVYEKLNDFYNSSCVDYRKQDDAADDTAFIEGRALFEGNRMFFASGYRAMENNFGILPYPKWDEKQETYRSYCGIEMAPTYAVPISTNGDMAANILDALAYFGDKMILPAYYDKTLKGKVVRDAESAEMLDIIYANAYCDFVQIYASFFNTAPSTMLASSIRWGTKLSREFAGEKRALEAKMKQLIEMLDVQGEE